jgi:hypothetical protein
MYNNSPNALIICFTDTIAQQLIQQDLFELDMLFKRIAGPFNKVVFAAFNKQFN